MPGKVARLCRATWTTVVHLPHSPRGRGLQGDVCLEPFHNRRVLGAWTVASAPSNASRAGGWAMDKTEEDPDKGFMH